MTYYHVCTKWDGSNLESLYKQHGEDAYEMFAAKWPEASELAQYHADIIHLHSNLDDAKEFCEEYGGEILVISDPDSELNIKIDTLEYAHPVVYGEIDAEYISRFED